jgi:dienelactone hydrolase
VSTYQDPAGTVLVDPSKIALAGHSYGGALVLVSLTKTLAVPPAVTIDMSGGVLSWAGGVTPPATTAWQDDLPPAAAQHTMPLYVHMTSTESSSGHDPADDVFDYADGAATDVEAHTYSGSVIPSGFSAQKCPPASVGPLKCAHLYFLESQAEAQRWLPPMFAFMARHGVL